MTDERRPIAAPPIHPLAAFAIIALDGIFGAFEIVDPFLLVVTCIVVGLLGFSATTMVQRFVSKEDWGVSIAKGLVMGILAGVPYPIVGTVIGAPLLIWAGVHQWVKLPGRDSQPLLDNPKEKR